MIFGKEYDLSLWYMLKVRNQYRKKAIDFVKELPEEFLENIRTTYLKGIENNAGVDDGQDKFYNVQSKINPNIYYKFYIMCRDLYIYKIRIVDGISRKVFSLVLNPNDSSDIMHLEKSKERMLGSICTGQYPEISFKEVDYNLKKSCFGYMLSHTYVLLGNMIEIKLGRPASINNMPDEMYREESAQKRLIKMLPKNDSKNK